MTKRRQPNPDSRSSDADKAKSTPVFLQKIYKILDSSPEDVASWSDAGDTFIVKLPSRFAKEILPHYFKTDNFSRFAPRPWGGPASVASYSAPCPPASFVRQLNFYGFRKVRCAGPITPGTGAAATPPPLQRLLTVYDGVRPRRIARR